MYCCHLIVIRRSLFQALGGMRKECDGSQDYDLALRATEKARSIAHLPLILYHWRASSGSTALSPAAKEYTSRAAEKALADALRRRNIQAKPALHKWASDAGVWRFALSFPDTGPSVTLLIPTKYRVEVLRRCLESLKKTSYLNYDVLVIDNESENPEMLEYLHTLNCRVARIGNNGPSFNFSHVNNVAARLVDSEYILFLNDDTEVLAPHWLSSMMGYAQIEGVGAVGARLLYPDGRIQHAGIVNGVRGGLPDHAFKLQRGDFKGRLDLARLTRNVSGVTAACLLTKRSLFLQLGGFDELNFPRAFQDPDYCLKLIAKGYRIVYCSEAELVHHESTSRPKDLDSEEHKRYAQKYWMFKDPYYSPHFSLDAPPAMQIRPQRWATSSIPFMRAAIVLPNASSRVLSILLFHVLSELRRQHVIDPFILAHEQCEMRDAYQASGYRLRVSDRAFVADEDRAVRSRVQHELKNIIDNEGIELIWAFGIENIDALLMARHQAIPAIWTLQDSAPQELERMASDEIRRLSEILYIPYRVVFNSWETKELFRSWGYSLNADVVPLVAPRLSEFELHEWDADEKGKDESFQGANWDSLDIAVHRYAEIVGEAYYTKGIARSHDFSRNRIGFQGARSGITVKIYQLFFHSEQIRDLDPHFIPHDGCENPHPHHYETYWFTKLWSRQWHKKADYTGFLSPKFGLKTCLEGYQFRKFIEDNPGHDVYFVNPFPHETYLFFNVWDHGEACHPGLVALAQDLFDRVEPGIQIHYLGRNDISTALFCNYWVGNALFWDEFMAFVKPLYEFIVKEMDNEDRARFFSPVPYVREAPAFPFIFERLFSTFLLLRRDIRACAYRLSAEEISRIYSQSVDPSHWKKVEPMVALIDAWDEKRDPEGDTKQQREEFLTLWTQGVPLSA
jgi:GT2 family glycosyltransferase